MITGSFMDEVKCPFQPGDRVHELRCLPVLARSFAEAAFGLDNPQFELDTSKPDATVLSVTESGFTYRYDHRVPIGRAAWGAWTEGGECFPEGYAHWRKIE